MSALAKKLLALEELAAKATAGPWSTRFPENGITGSGAADLHPLKGAFSQATLPAVYAPEGVKQGPAKESWYGSVIAKVDQYAKDDATFIAVSRTAVPVLLAFLRRIITLHMPTDPEAYISQCNFCGEPWPCLEQSAARKTLEELP